MSGDPTWTIRGEQWARVRATTDHEPTVSFEFGGQPTGELTARQAYALGLAALAAARLVDPTAGGGGFSGDWERGGEWRETD